MRRLVLLALVLGALGCGCTKGNAGASPQGRLTTKTAAPATTAPAADTTTPVSVPAPKAITSDGGTLWNLEALLKATFGDNQPSSADNTDTGPTNPSDPPKRSTTATYVDFNCAGDQCSPLSVYQPYRYTFSDPTGSSFHLSKQNYAGWSFGNYPEPVLINGKIVACNPQESTFLIRLSDASSFTLECLPPESRG
jgi:hypothetical protein